MLKEVEIDPDESLTRRWGTRADDVRVKRAMAALQANGITVLRASDAAAAKRIVLDLIPDASPVHQGASQTLDALGITNEIEKSGRYAALRPRIWSMDRETEADEIRRLGAAPDESFSSSARRRSCTTSRKVSSASTNTRGGSKTPAPKPRMAYAAP